MSKKNKEARKTKGSKLGLKREVLKRLTRTLDDEQLKEVGGAWPCTTGSTIPTS
jgi:hypothetical protein